MPHTLHITFIMTNNHNEPADWILAIKKRFEWGINIPLKS